MGVGSSKSIRCCERRCDEHPVTVIPPVEKSPLASATDEKLDEHGDDEPTDVVEDSPPVAEVVYEDDDPDPYTPVEEVGDPDECKARGNAHFKAGQLEKAYLAYGEAIELRPDDATFWLNRSIAARQLKRWDKSYQDAARAVTLGPPNVKAHYSKAYALDQLGRREEALEICAVGSSQFEDAKVLEQLQKIIESVMKAGGDGDKVEKIRKAAGLSKEAAAPRSDAKSKPQAKKKVTTVQSGFLPGCSSKSKPAKLGCPAVEAVAAADEQLKKLKQNEELKKEIKQNEEMKAAADKQVADVIAGLKLPELQGVNPEQGGSNGYTWAGRMPCIREREGLKVQMTDIFLDKYAELKQRREQLEKESDERESQKSILETDMYSKEQGMGLTIQGGHQPMPRPEGIDIPASFRDPVENLTVDQLKGYSIHNEERRFFVAVYGYIFDVSDRPDKYGPGSPYEELTGSDITWGLFTGIDTKEMCNRFYDLYKAKDMGKDKLAGICSWLAWYETEYGKAVGRVDVYTREWDLPEPPLEECEDACTVM